MSRPLALFVSLLLVAPAIAEVKIGSAIDDLKFKDIRYVARSLADFGDKKAIVLVFVECGCPLAQKYMPVLDRLEKSYRDKSVQFVAVNVGPTDTVVAMAAQAVEYRVEFPFVKDIDGRVADAVGVTRTPEVAVLDGKRTLRYRGRIDDQYRPGGQRPAPTRNDLVEAIDAVLAGKDVAVPTTPVDGCVITRGTAAVDRPVTYADHVAPILARHCVGCHKPDTPAPFALRTYEEAKARARTLAEVVAEGRMPPWYGVPRTGDLIQHKSLSAAERETIARWVATGLARGDDAKLPKPIDEKPTQWRIGEPDLVLSSAPFDLPKTGDIPYKYVLFLTHPFAADTWVQGVQILPDVPRAVHHANLAYVKIGESFKESNFITGVVPGGEPMTLDGGVAFLIPKGTILGLQVHYVPTGKEEKVGIRVGLKYARGTVDQRLRNMLFVDTKYGIPPGAPAHAVKVERTMPADAIGVGLFSHMHVRGKAMSFTATGPDGKSEKLLTIPNYNFEWQIPYRWEPGKKVLAKGTKIVCEALYDNSPFNPYNPDPTKLVKDGPQTYHEMLNGFLFYVEKDEKLGLEVDAKTGRTRGK